MGDLGWPTLNNMESEAADIGNSNSSLGLVDRVEEGRIALYQLEKHLDQKIERLILNLLVSCEFMFILLYLHLQVHFDLYQYWYFYQYFY